MKDFINLLSTIRVSLRLRRLCRFVSTGVICIFFLVVLDFLPAFNWPLLVLSSSTSALSSTERRISFMKKEVNFRGGELRATFPTTSLDIIPFSLSFSLSLLVGCPLIYCCLDRSDHNWLATVCSHIRSGIQSSIPLHLKLLILLLMPVIMLSWSAREETLLTFQTRFIYQPDNTCLIIV